MPINLRFENKTKKNRRKVITKYFFKQFLIATVKEKLTTQSNSLHSFCIQ